MSDCWCGYERCCTPCSAVVDGYFIEVHWIAPFGRPPAEIEKFVTVQTLRLKAGLSLIPKDSAHHVSSRTHFFSMKSRKTVTSDRATRECIADLRQQLASASKNSDIARNHARIAKVEFKKTRKVFKQAKRLAKEARKKVKALKRMLAGAVRAVPPAVAAKPKAPVPRKTPTRRSKPLGASPKTKSSRLKTTRPEKPVGTEVPPSESASPNLTLDSLPQTSSSTSAGEATQETTPPATASPGQ